MDTASLSGNFVSFQSFLYTSLSVFRSKVLRLNGKTTNCGYFQKPLFVEHPLYAFF